MKNVYSLISLLIMSSGFIFSQTTVSVDLQKNSWLSINGTTNITSFKLVHNGEKLLGKAISMIATQKQNRIYTSKNQLSIAVKNFTSENKMALRDFLKLLKLDTYPNLNVQLNYIETPANIEKDRYTQGNAFVNITIAGITKQYNIPISSNQHGEDVSVDGGKKINIRDFGLEAPEEMFGLIKVSEWINIDFHLVGKLTLSGDIQTKSTFIIN